MSLVLDARLARDTFMLGDLQLCRVLLMNDVRFPWLILVPRREGAVELTDLGRTDRATLVEETAAAAEWLKHETDADKINVGALGNIVPQFHMHVVARKVGDPAWPGAVWGHGTAQPYSVAEGRRLLDAARAALGATIPTS